MRRHTKYGFAAGATALFFALVTGACSGTNNTGLTGQTGDSGLIVCVPGAQTACACPGGASGIQVCSADGTGLGACQCGAGGADAGEDGSLSDAAINPFHDAAIVDSAIPDSAIKDTGPYDANQLLDAGCTVVTAIRQPTYMLIVLDGSGSMSEDNKWTGVTPALDALFDDILAQNDKNLGVGLVVFSDSLDPTAGVGPYPSAKDVSIGYVNQAQHDLLRARIDSATPTNATPTYAALTGGYGALEKLVPAAPLPADGKKVLVLMTDGVPNGLVNPTPSEQDQCIAAATAETTKSAPLGPVTTFVVGTGPFPSTDTTSYDPVFLGGLANAGGAAPQGCKPSETQTLANLCYFQVTPNGKPAQTVKTDFLAAIDKIREQITSCEFGLPPGNINAQNFNVVLDDGNGGSNVVVAGLTNGWTFDNPLSPKEVVLHGASCTALRANAAASVHFLEGCPTAP